MYSVCPRCRLRVVVSNLARARIRACQVPGDGSLGCMLVRGVGAEGACHARVRVGAALSRRLPWRSRHDTRRQAKPRHARRAKFVRWSVGRQTTTRWLLVGWWWWQWQWQWRQPAAGVFGRSCCLVAVSHCQAVKRQRGQAGKSQVSQPV